ncbi:hypothetical protein TKK_0012380 [Trichogramma kaykai]|uniref:RAD50-interacting protein 1 n=1 Tax=Trichogramma kaykai TaxID=54128 RepID=A0ABD2WN59_9HYME
MDVKGKVIKLFNAEFGSSLNNLKNLDYFQAKLDSKKSDVEECLSLASSKAPSRIQAAVEDVNKIVKQTDEIKEQSENICSLIEKCLQQENKTDELQTLIDDISYLEKSAFYMQFIECVEGVSSDLESSLCSNIDEACIASYVYLKDTYTKIELTLCTNLKSFMRDTVQYWFDQIEKKLTIEYNEILKILKWPFCGNNSGAQFTHSSTTLTEFKIVTEHLFHLQLPDSLVIKSTTGLESHFPQVCLPVTLLVQPFITRFRYHFQCTKQTNRRDKPEWYFTQLLSWLRDHIDWIEKMVQPVANGTNLKKTDVKVEFIRSLAKLAVNKLYSEMDSILYDDKLFAHTVDEAINFENELRSIYQYPSSEHATVLVLSQPQFLSKWLAIERKCATEKMDMIFSSPNAWVKVVGFEEDSKITECAEKFLLLLRSISDRYNKLPQLSHRCQFLDLQLELIDDWRVRILQLLHEHFQDPLQSFVPSILNTVHYVTKVLEDWGATHLYMELQDYKVQALESANNELENDFSEYLMKDIDVSITVFDGVISLLQRLHKKLMKEIIDTAITSIKIKSKPYFNEKWFTMPGEKEIAFFSITPTGQPMFQEIYNKLHIMDEVLAKELFKQAWKDFAMQLDQFILDELLLRNQFNSGGASQLTFDIKKSLYPSFGLYTSKPEILFPLISESCSLLNMLLGSAMLLLEALETEEENVAKEVLADVSIYELSPPLAIKILKHRMDISSR